MTKVTKDEGKSHSHQFNGKDNILEIFFFGDIPNSIDLRNCSVTNIVFFDNSKPLQILIIGSKLNTIQ